MNASAEINPRSKMNECPVINVKPEINARPEVSLLQNENTTMQKNGTAMDTEETKRLKENFGSIAPATLAYAVLYVFCMYRNGSGITFPFFVGGSLIFLRYSSSRLGITLKKGSAWYMVACLLLGISTFCTDDGRIIFFNKLGIFLLAMSLLLKQYFDTAGWKFGKYLASIAQLVFASFGELGRPVTDGMLYRKKKEGAKDTKGWYVALGLLAGIPLLFVVLALLASADAIFGQMTSRFLEAVNIGNLFRILLRIAVVFFAAYALTAYLCKRKIKEEVPDRRRGEPVLAITVTGLLTAVYLLFSAVQIGGLFLGQLALPEGYTYAMYAREGFFQLLAVSFLNLGLVLACMSYFRESRALMGILTVMSVCTFVMIASSAMRMMLYIQSYDLTFLRILVLWGLALLAVLFVGVTVSIFRRDFPLFGYSMAAVAVLYLGLSFAHPDLIIAKVNTAKTPQPDYVYLHSLSADAAPVLVPYLESLDYHMEAFREDSPLRYGLEMEEGSDGGAFFGQNTFGYYWMEAQKEDTAGMHLRNFNLSRYLALRLLEGR